MTFEAMSVSLSEIKQPIQNELDKFEQFFRDSMRSNVALLDRIMHYIVQRKGKQIRPMFVFLSAKLLGTVNDSSYTAAALLELMHTATLVHDDVVDDAHKRRGVFSINALWKNKIAVLVGDYLLAKGLLLSLGNKEYSVLEIMSDSVKEMSEGELLQMDKARKLDIDETVYYDIIRKKTASLIASACAAGASSVNASTDDVKKMKDLGETIGMAFQIKDDLFDYGETEIGKPRGIDIKERKMTLPLIYALSNASNTEKRFIINTVKNDNQKQQKVKELIKLVKSKGGIEYTKQKMQTYVSRAKEILNSFEPNQARNSIEKLIDFTVERAH